MIHFSDYHPDGSRRHTSDAYYASLEAREQRERYSTTSLDAVSLPFKAIQPPAQSLDPQTTLKARYYDLLRREEGFFAGKGVEFSLEDERELGELKKRFNT